MASKDTYNEALNLINSDLAKSMEENIESLKEFDDKFQNGIKSAGAKARKQTTAWGKALSARIKELREIKKLFSQYRKETVSEKK